MESATRAVPTEALHEQVPIDTDHSEMVKFRNMGDFNYITIKDRRSKCVQWSQMLQKPAKMVHQHYYNSSINYRIF
jgi:hypothetical protein